MILDLHGATPGIDLWQFLASTLILIIKQEHMVQTQWKHGLSFKSMQKCTCPKMTLDDNAHILMRF